MSKEIWCTLGPSSLNDRVVGRLEELGVSLFRLNLSHTKIDKLPQILEFLHSRTKVPVCLDSEGAQIRTGDLTEGKVVVCENQTVRIHHDLILGNANDFSLSPQQITRQLVVGDLLKIDAEVLVQVVEFAQHCVIARVLNGGEMGQNKAVTLLERDIDMPALTEKDKQAMAIGREMGIRHVALSFANRAADVDEMRSFAPDGASVTSKIECLNGLRNLVEITAKSDALLIDRGDLSRQVSIERVPIVQKDIIRHARLVGARIFVATNLLESMIVSANPTRAEVNDVFNTLTDGADGLVLAAETAIGAYPVAAASMIKKLIYEYENRQRWQMFQPATEPISTLIEPHGGRLVNYDLAAVDPQSVKSSGCLTIAETDLLDCVQIANGTFSPVTGFMSAAELDSVLEHHRLPGGDIWTMPILLPVDEQVAAELCVGNRVALADGAGKTHAVLDVSEIYTYDLDKLTRKWFGTSAKQHPGVTRIMSRGNQFVAGKVQLVGRRVSPYAQYELTPRQSRTIFAQKGWSRVVGFYTGNVAIKVHESVQAQVQNEAMADGILINLAVAEQNVESFLPGSIIDNYQVLLRAGVYPAGNVVLGAALLYPRHSGAREVLFNALCHKNLGCSHFVVAAYDQVNNKDLRAEVRKLFEDLEGIEITPMFLDIQQPRETSAPAVIERRAERKIKAAKTGKELEAVTT